MAAWVCLLHERTARQCDERCGFLLCLLAYVSPALELLATGKLFRGSTRRGGTRSLFRCWHGPPPQGVPSANARIEFHKYRCDS